MNKTTMKKFTTVEIIDLFNRVMIGEISFSHMVEILNERMSKEEKCVEDTPVHKFQNGDKVRIKHGVSSKTHRNISPGFVEEMDKFIGKELIVENWGGFVKCDGYYFSENWLEPYEELKKGDLVIFWDSYQEKARIGVYNQFYYSSSFPHEDHIGNCFRNAIKFESEKQFKRLINGEI